MGAASTASASGRRYIHPDFRKPVLLYGLLGQSNLDGRAQWRDVHRNDVPQDGAVEGAYILDRCAQMLRLRDEPESHMRPLTPGFTEMDTAPWLNQKNDWFGIEVSFAHALSTWFSDFTIGIVKLGVGGSITGKRKHWTWNVNAQPEVALLDAYRRAYIATATGWLTARGAKYKWGGFISYVGTSDARFDSDAKGHAANMRDIIQNLRECVGAEVPWLHIKPFDYHEPPPDNRPVRNIRTVRQQADRLAAIPGVSVQDLSNPSFHEDDWLHQDADGLINTGFQAARWAASQHHERAL